MGYSSEVGLILSKKAHEQLLEALNKTFGDEKTLFNEWRDTYKKDEKTGTVLYSWSGIKWYGDECDFVNGFLDGLDSKEYLFIRLGEEYGDIDDHGCLHNPPFSMYTTSKLEIY